MTPLLSIRRRCGVPRRRCPEAAFRATGRAAGPGGGVGVATAAGDGWGAVDTAPRGGLGWLTASPSRLQDHPARLLLRLVRSVPWPRCHRPARPPRHPPEPTP